MLLTLIAALALTAQTPPPAANATPPAVSPQRSQVQEACMVVTSANEQQVNTPFPALKLGSLTATQGLPGLPTTGILMVRCERSQFGLGDQDYRVLTEYRLPLLIVSPEAAGVMEMENGALRLRMVRGGLTDEGAAVFRQVLDASATAASAAAARTSPASQPAAQKQGSRPSAAPAQAKQPVRR